MWIYLFVFLFPTWRAVSADQFNTYRMEPYDEFGQRFDTFDWQLYNTVARSNTGNIIISPISVKLLLKMLYEGSTGFSSSELARALDLPKDKSTSRLLSSVILRSLQTKNPEYELQIGSKIFINENVTPKNWYQRILYLYYNAYIEKLDFENTKATADLINYWVKMITHDRIKDFLTSDDGLESTVMLLINAVYFKGSWVMPFPKGDTHTGKFHTPYGPKDVSYMMQTGYFYYSRSAHLRAQILRLPYLGQKFSMYIILPEAQDGLDELVRTMNPAELRKQIWQLEETSLEVILPKFKYDFKIELKDVLRQLGIRKIFESFNDMKGLTKNAKIKDLVVSNVVQKAAIEVSEEGSVAAAATEFQLINKFGGNDELFNATHPFLYFIEDESTETIVFIGKFVYPEGSEKTSMQPANATSTSTSTPAPSSVYQQRIAPAAASQFLKPIGIIPAVLSTTPAGRTEATHQSHDNPYKPSPNRYNYFDAELLEVLSREREGNVLVSPVSVKAVLAMLMEGAAGKSVEEIRIALRLPADSHMSRTELQRRLSSVQKSRSPNVLKLAYGMFVSEKYNMKPRYQKSVEANYDSDVVRVRFDNPREASRIINGWTRNKTSGLIEMIADESAIDADAKIMLANTIYFQGKWNNPFPRESTTVKCFWTARGECVKVPMMSESGEYKYAYVNKLDADVVELPYEGGRFSMLIVLPKKKSGSRQLSRDMIHVGLDDVLAEMTLQEIRVEIPRFTVGYDVDLVPFLRKLQITEVFSRRANLSGMSSDKNETIAIGNVFHSAKIIVDEEGSKAAAATGAFVVPLMGETTFAADHPFLFFLRDGATGTVLFSGRIEKPEGIAGTTGQHYKNSHELNSPMRKAVTSPPPSAALDGFKPGNGHVLRKPNRALPSPKEHRVAPDENAPKQLRINPIKSGRKRYYQDAIRFLNSREQWNNRHY